MHKAWQLQEAKNKFSEVVEEAIHHGPQTVTRHGQETVIILSIKDYRKLRGVPKESFAEFMMRSPLRGVELDLKRDKSLPRDVSL
jgi:prevent-host-death family protein